MFHAYVDQVLVLELKPGDVVVLDNLSADKVSGVSQILEKVGATLHFLPPYSPDFNPIENAISQIKSILKKIAARTKDALDLTRALNQTHHCRYDCSAQKYRLSHLVSACCDVLLIAVRQAPLMCGWLPRCKEK